MAASLVTQQVLNNNKYELSNGIHSPLVENINIQNYTQNIELQIFWMGSHKVFICKDKFLYTYCNLDRQYNNLR